MATKQNTELQQELERTADIRGFRYGLHEFVAAVGGVEALREHNETVNYDKPSLIDRRHQELLRIAIQCTDGSPLQIIQCHMHAAQRAGSSPEEVMEVVKMVSGSGRQRGFEAWRLTFRPDLPTIERVVELR